MNGWMSVLFMLLILLSGAVVAVRKAARRWWDYLSITALAIAIGPLLFDAVGADVSRYTPTQLWSDGAEAKDQIIWAGVFTTLLLPIFCAAFVWLLAKMSWRHFARSGGKQGFDKPDPI